MKLWRSTYKAIKKSKINSGKSKLENYNNVKLNFSIGYLVLIKNKINLKQDLIWIGLYGIVGLGQYHIEIEKWNLVEKISKRNVQLL